LQVRKLILYMKFLLWPNLELFPGRRPRFGHGSVVVWGHHFRVRTRIHMGFILNRLMNIY